MFHNVYNIKSVTIWSAWYYVDHIYAQKGDDSTNRFLRMESNTCLCGRFSMRD